MDGSDCTAILHIRETSVSSARECSIPQIMAISSAIPFQVILINEFIECVFTLGPIEFTNSPFSLASESSKLASRTVPIASECHQTLLSAAYVFS